MQYVLHINLSTGLFYSLEIRHAMNYIKTYNSYMIKSASLTICTNKTNIHVSFVVTFMNVTIHVHVLYSLERSLWTNQVLMVKRTKQKQNGNGKQ